MKLIGFLFKIPLVIAAALLGNQVGYIIREKYLGKTGHNLRLYQKGPNEEITIAINPILTNFIPAALFGLVSKPGWPAAFLTGTVLAAMFADEYEEQFMAMLGVESGTDSAETPAGSPIP